MIYRFLTAFGVLFFAHSGLAGQSIFTNPITGTNPNTSNPYTTGQTIDPNITVSGIGRGSGISGSDANNRYNATGWNSAAIDLNDYFEWTLTPSTGYEIDFTDLVYTGQASGTGPTSFAIRSSLDGFMASIGSPNATGTIIDLSAAVYQNITTAITFRFYGWGASSGGGTFSINDFTFQGSVNSTGPSPEIEVELPLSITISCGSTVSFGTTVIGTPVDITGLISNEGTADLTITTPIVTGGTHSGDFSISTQPSSTITAGNSSSFSISFTPSATGVRTASISITNNDGNENPCVINLSGTGVLPNYYFRSRASGSWFSASTWEVSLDNTNWSNATSVPLLADNTITVQSGNTVTIPTGQTVTIDELIIENGGILVKEGPSATLSIQNGPGVDLNIQGTLADNGASSSGNTTFATGARWQLGASGTLIKTSDGSSNNYRDNYEGGIANIPSTADWIIRFTGSNPIAVSSVGGMHYPNLTIENVAGGNYTPNSSIGYFNGNSDYPRIKGNFNIGTSGSGSVSFINIVTNATPLQVEGDFNLGPGSTFSNNVGSTNGTGMAVAGDVTINGTLLYSFGNGILELNGGADQTISGIGSINVQRLQINKPGGKAIMAKNLWIRDQLILTQGNIQLNTYDLTVRGSATGGSDFSFAETNSTGALRMPSGGAKTFPVGNSSYNPAIVNNTGTTDTFAVRVADQVLTEGTTGTPFGSFVVDRTWFITERVATGSNAAITLQWNPANELTAFDRTDCYVSRHNGSQWVAGPASGASGSDPYTQTMTGVISFSPFAVGSNLALPVELLGFTGKAHDGGALLQWQTAAEAGFSHFEVEKLTDREFITRHTEAAKGSGSAYTFFDPALPGGYHYYRLRMVDYSGEIAFSPIVAVLTGEAPALRIFPNPAYEQATVLFPESQVEGFWQLFDVTGRVVREGGIAAGASQLEMPTADLLPGHYYLNLYTGVKTYGSLLLVR